MTNKAFEIQSSTLRLGGIELEAGITGVVIPGVTQATNYLVEEVNKIDRQISPNDPPTEFNNTPLIIDFVTYSDYLNNGTSTGRATYICEMDDNEIDEINVNTPGIYIGSEVDRNATADLFAYAGTEPDPFVIFTASDWVQIPFRPKMRVGEVENIGGVGAGNKLVNGNNEVVLDENGDTTLPGDITTGIDGQGGRFIQDCADGTTSMRWINVNKGSDNTQIIRAYTGDPELETEVERAQIKLNWDETEDKSGLTIRTFNDGTTNDWQFKGNGHLEFPDGSVQVTAYTGQSGPGTGLGSITVPAQGTSYKGLQVSYGMIHSNGNSNELNVNKIVIHKPAMTTTEIDPTSENDYFQVAGLSDSDVLAMFVIYGDVNGSKPLSDLKAFAEAAIDTVILNNAVEEDYNTVDQMKAAFYDNYPTLVSVAGGLDQDFLFFQNFANAATGITTTREGSGAIFTFEEAAGSYSFLSIANGGSNYLPGHKLVVLGSALGGTDGINDAVFTVNTVDAGAITSVNLGGTSFATAPVGGWTFPASNYQVGSGFVVAGIGKNLDTTLYANINSQGSGYVVDDVLTLLGSDLQGGLSPDNDITITVTAVDGAGAIQNWTVTGTFVNVWPDNFIGDGGNDQYDTANYINSSFTNQIAYNAGNTVSDGTTAFGTGSSYSFVYNTGIFGLFVSGNSSTYIETSGGSGADGNSITEAGNIYGPNEPAKTYNNAINYINVISNPYAGPAVNFVKTDGGSEVDILIPDSGVSALETIYLEQEQQWIDVRNQDAADISPATRTWAGMPSYQAYDIMVATFPVEPAPPGNILPVANNAKNAYLVWQEALAEFGPDRGVGITRNNNNGIFNPYRESGWDENISPDGIGWNIDGWGDLSNVATREYVNLYAAFGFGGLGNKIVGAECIIYLPDNGKYYTVKFSQWTQGGNGGGFAYTRRELDINNLSEGIGFADGSRLTSAEGIGRVKLQSPGERRIEEASGFKAVTLTARTTTNLTTTASRAASNQNEIWFDTTNTDIDNVLDTPQNFGNAYKFEFSLDNTNWYTWGGGISFDGTERGYNVFPQAVTYNQGDTIYFRYSTGGTPVVWWDKNDLPGGSANFRGAVIDYHAYTGESTIIGTIHIVDDDGEEYISHQEVQSGSTDGDNDDLWLVQNEGQIQYRRIDGESKTLKIHWTAKVFYGSEFYD